MTHHQRLLLASRIAAMLATVFLCSATASSAAEGRSAPRDMAERLMSAPLPGRDAFDLAVRLRGLSTTTPLTAPVPAAPLVTGFTDAFWILDQRTAQLFQSEATLRLVSPHAYWFVQTDMLDRAPLADLERSANVFETRTYPLIHQYFGAEPSPGVDGDAHIVLLLGNVPGVAAYFSSADAYPRAVSPRSNEHEMIYVNLNSLRPGQPGFDATLTHELQHMAHFAHCPHQEGWIDEGAAELAMRVAGYDASQPAAFAARPDVQLTTWSSQPADVARHYQASYLFLRYVAERAGGWDALPRLFETCARGEALLQGFLARQPIAPDLDDLFTDWTVANLLQDPLVADGRFAYAQGGFHAAVTGTASRHSPFLGSVPQYAANYVDLPIGPGTMSFQGDASVALLTPGAEETGVWWSNRGDMLDSRLSRALDLRGVSDATLLFRAWYDLEDQFDYVYVSASTDGGKHWDVLPGRRSVPDSATGNDFGVGWTGSSGGGWIEEEVDLTPFAGSEIILRFEYVTDQSYNAQGFGLKDVRVPQLGIDEAGAVDSLWMAEGWVRVDAPVPQRWNLRLVRWSPTGVQVDNVPVAMDGSAAFELDPAALRSTLVVAPTAPRTLLAGNYSLTAAP